MSLIKRRKCKIEADHKVVICPNCGTRIELKTMGRKYMVLILFLAVIFIASIAYFARDIATISSTSLSSSQPKEGAEVIEKNDEAEKIEAEPSEKAEAEELEQAKVEAKKEKSAIQESEAEKAKLAIKQKVNRSWIRPASTAAGLRCTIRVRLLSDGTVMDAEVISSSGNEDFDRSAKNAVNKASPLPVPKDKELFGREFRTFQFLFNPK